MKKVAVIAKSVCVNALVCSAAAVLLSACGAGMPDATKSKPGMFAGVMQVSAAVATNGTDADPATTPAVADQAAADAAAAGTEPASASGLPSVPGAEQGGAAVGPASGAVDQASVSAAPAAAPAGQVAPGTAGAPAANPAAAQGTDSFALVGYGPNAAGNQAAAAAATQGPVWPDPQDSASAIRQ